MGMVINIVYGCGHNISMACGVVIKLLPSMGVVVMLVWSVGES